MVTKAKEYKKAYRKGLPTMIAQSVGCSAKYVEQVLKGDHDDRDTEIVRNIKHKASEIENILKK
ncbi:MULTISPECIES: hypothetical protein [unclassified Sphingobacterium]|uniref:hypothetical protein n=1 Tax=unclassified Sphingobacterium TaxID=2609468 RepID=UPI0025E1ECB8|nr:MULTISPECIES: hypothetical protein [unclassified Sphingobacterium]